MAAHVQMPNELLAHSLLTLIGQQVHVGAGDAIYEDGAVRLVFTDKTELNATYWRFVRREGAGFSSFDEGQQYGFPTKIDAVARLMAELQDQMIADVILILEKGDLHFRFSKGDLLEVFRFTGYEVWDILFPDGTGQYSNYV